MIAFPQFSHPASVISPFSMRSFARASAVARLEITSSYNETVPSLSRFAIVPKCFLRKPHLT